MKQKYTFIFNKLVRDNIPEIMETLGAELISKTLSPDDYISKLKSKLLEESTEVLKSQSKEELIEEIADVFEVLYCLMLANNISMEDVESIRASKNESKGSFKKAKFIDKVFVNQDFKFLEYYRSKPDEYPELV
ncbi:nucleoside triphosphate pyrophosphohydrolase [Rickettsiales endosymbiont of Stachyamoeba lipophora]|uniref:nucleoside triphosphate pyrophosphohydrolase n=1 Tax=Rickettsiales endosymbiont of Stachyamoeba lipophora TaxID=2486578 RepID=UPI000F64D868|nr:nucleoside triphosphate pyrophosphohydrolase [Rickettsiales endosymbiont of Stachyamoeba lipophora]AZL16351.1 phosphoribosyl-ATP pyrophosphohydrolase [Rickettsiales endosymbiont of Stachyamoeba lipophora]